MGSPCATVITQFVVRQLQYVPHSNPGYTMQRITREQARKYAFDWRDEPLLRVKPGESFDLVAKNKLGERAQASYAVDGEALLLRTQQALYRIEKK